MALVARLDIILQASIAPFQKGTQEAVKTLSNFGSQVSRIGTTVQVAAGAINAAFGSIAGSTTAAVAGSALTLLGEAAKPVAVAIGAVARTVGATLTAAVSTASSVVSAFSPILNAMGQAFDTAVSSVSGLIGGLVGGIASAGGGLFGAIGKVAGVMGNVLSAAAGVAATALSGVANVIGTALSGALQTASALLGSLAKSFMSVAGALTQLALSQFEAIVGQGRLAAKLGISNQDLAAFGLVAKKAGLDLEDLVRPLHHLDVAIGEAALGSGEAMKTFAQLGLSIDDLRRMGPAEQFVAVAQAIDKIGDRATRAALSQKLLSRGAAELKSVVADLAKGGLDAARDKAGRFGLFLSPDDQARVTQTKRAIGDIEKVWEGLKNKIAVAVAPGFERIATSIGSMLQRITTADLTSWGDAFSKSILGVEFLVGNLPKVWSTAWTSIRDFTSSLAEDMTRILAVFAQEAAGIFADLSTVIQARVLSGGFNTGLVKRAEDALAATVRTAGARVAMEFAKPFKAQVGDIFNDLKAGFGEDLQKFVGDNFAKLKGSKFALAGIAGFGPALLGAGPQLAGGGAAGAGGLGRLSDLLPPALEKGSKEAFEAIAKAQQQGGAPAIERDQLAALQIIAERQKDIVAAVKGIQPLAAAPL